MEESIRVPMTPAEALGLSSLSLAYVGDTIHDLIIREEAVRIANRPVKELHKFTTAYVKADAQAVLYDALASAFEEGTNLPLSEEEFDIMRRGRNQSHGSGRGSSVGEYRKATGFEALLGYLYLTGKEARAREIVKTAMELAGVKL